MHSNDANYNVGMMPNNLFKHLIVPKHWFECFLICTTKCEHFWMSRYGRKYMYKFDLTYYVQKSIRTFKIKNCFEPLSDAPKAISVWEQIYDALNV